MFITSHGTDIYYEVHGSGDRTLLFAHGMGGNAAVWFNQLAAFVDQYRVIVFDHRHFGRSKCTEAEFKPALFADDALAILDQEDTNSAVFICQSMGGWTGSQVALNHRDRIDGLVMSHTPGIFYHTNAKNDGSAVADLVSQPTTSFHTPALAVDFPDRNFAGAVLYHQIAGFNDVDRAVVPRAIGEADIGVDTTTLDGYNVPTLFITADKDVLFPPDFIKALAGTVPGAGFKNLGDAGHSSYFETPDAFNATVADFLEDLV
jgi:pimeloyl-ACP methyl ester carboxylesterase